MKTNILKRLTGMTLILLAIVSVSMAQQKSTLNLEDYSLKIKGTSNLHDWTMEAEEITGNLTTTQNGSTLKDFKDGEITVDVEEIESGKRIMNNKTYDALESDKHPNISYELKSIKDQYVAGTRFSGKAVGLLTIAGKAKTVEIPFSGKVTNGGSTISVSGDYSLQMTTYEVEPPTAMLGSLKTGDAITIEFEFTFNQ